MQADRPYGAGSKELYEQKYRGDQGQREVEFSEVAHTSKRLLPKPTPLSAAKAESMLKPGDGPKVRAILC